MNFQAITSDLLVKRDLRSSGRWKGIAELIALKEDTLWLQKYIGDIVAVAISQDNEVPLDKQVRTQ